MYLLNAERRTSESNVHWLQFMQWPLLAGDALVIRPKDSYKSDHHLWCELQYLKRKKKVGSVFFFVKKNTDKFEVTLIGMYRVLTKMQSYKPADY
jgi:hypothetical protein